MNHESSILREILVHCSGGPAALKPLLAIHSRATLYRRVQELVEQKYLEKRDDRYLTTPAGDGLLKAPQVEVDTDRDERLVEVFPHFPYLPTQLHWAAALLVIGAATARKFLGMSDSLASFALLGPPMKWKTKLAEALLSILGAPAENLVYSPSEGGRSLFVRKNSKGGMETIREVMDKDVVAFDEYHKASPEVKGMIGAYLHGRRELPFENETLELKPTPLILLNPVRETGHILERLNVDEAQFRRLVAVDFAQAAIPVEIEDKGTEFLQEIRKLGPITMKPPTGLSAASRERFKTAVKEAVEDKAHLRFIDFTMVGSIIEGLTGYLGEEHAVRAGVTAYIRCLWSIGFAGPGWRSVLARAFETPPPAAAPQPASQNSFDYRGNLQLLHESLRTLGRSNEDLGTVVEEHAVLVRLLRDLGVPPKLFFGMVRETIGDAEKLGWVREILERLKKGRIVLLKKELQDGDPYLGRGYVTKAPCECQRWGDFVYTWDALCAKVTK